MRVLLLGPILLASLASVSTSCQRGGLEEVFGEPGPEALREEAVAYASAFLTVVDTGASADTWAMVATTVQQRAGRDTWVRTLEAARAELGAQVSRRLARFGYTQELADAPPGEYFVLEFESNFERAAVVERVVCFRQGGRDWKVAGYFATTQ